MKKITHTLAITALGLLISCAGSTEFVEESPTLTVGKGSTETLNLTFRAEGSHAGDYSFTATVRSGTGLTATIAPSSAAVDEQVTLTLSVTATASASSSGSVSVAGDDGEGHYASTSVSISTQ